MSLGSKAHRFRGGAILLFDLAGAAIRCVSVGHVTSNEWEKRMRECLTKAYADPVLRLLVEMPTWEALGVLNAVGPGR